jgi:ABC-type transport system substrate-binding protein
VTKEVIKTVEVEKPVIVRQEVVKTVEVEKIVVREVTRQPKGVLRVAEGVLQPLTQLQAKDAGGSVGGPGVDWQVYEGLINPQLKAPGVVPSEVIYEPGLARAWVVAHDLSSITFSLQEGVQWHGGWGEFTAEDVVWTYNNSFKEGSVGNAGDQLSAGHKVGWEVFDKYTAIMNIAPDGFDTTWGVYHGGFGWDNTYGMTCKHCFDELGEDKFMITPIGTGPYRAVKWASGDEARMEWVGSHWKHVPYVETLLVFEIPEELTREAALRTGEVDMAPVSIANLADVVRSTGGTGIPMGMAWPQTINMSGNYWAQECPTCAEGDRDWATKPPPGYTPDAAHPWIGRWGDDVSMENARKVRWAMAMAIDRDLIAATVMKGFSEPVYIAFHTQFNQNTPYWKEEWRIPFDPTLARQYLADAGVADGFPVEIWSTDVAPHVWNPEVMDAVAAMWREHLNLDVTLDRTPYATRRPTTVTHEINVPWHHGWGRPAGGSMALFYCAGPGHIMGVALPKEICDIGFQNDTEPDVSKRIENNIVMQDFMQKWMTQIGVVNQTPHWVYLPRVVQWQPYFGVKFNHPTSVILK